MPQAKDGGREEISACFSPPVKCVAFDSPLSEGAETAGAKFSEFGHPFVCFADISPNRGITPPYRINTNINKNLFSACDR